MFRQIVRGSMVVLAPGFAACDDVPTTVPVDDSEAVFDPTFDVTLPPDGGICPDVFYEQSRLLGNGVTVTWTRVLAGFDYAEGTGYMADVKWSIDQGTPTYQDFTGRNGPNTWSPKRNVDGVMTPGAAGGGTLPVTVSMMPMHESGGNADDDDDDDGGWAGKTGNGHFWFRLEIDNGGRRPRRVKLGVNFHLEDPADGFGTQCPGDDPPLNPPAGNQPPTANAGPNQTVTDNEGATDTDQVVITVEAAPPAPISFAADVQPYFLEGQANCVRCHSGGGPAGVDLDSYAHIIAADPAGRVVPQLLRNHNDGPDDADFVVILRQWIDEGSQNN